MANISDLLGLNTAEPPSLAPYILKQQQVNSDVDAGRLLYFERGQGLLPSDKIEPDLYNPTYTEFDLTNIGTNFMSSLNTFGAACFWRANGTKFIVFEYDQGGQDVCGILTASTPYDISTLTLTDQFNLGPSAGRTAHGWVSEDGLTYIAGITNSGAGTYTWTVDTPFTSSNLTLQSFDSNTFFTGQVLDFSQDGLKMYVDSNGATGQIFEVVLSVPFDRTSQVSSTLVFDSVAELGSRAYDISVYAGGQYAVICTLTRAFIIASPTPGTLVGAVPVRDLSPPLGNRKHSAIDARVINGELLVSGVTTNPNPVAFTIETGYDGLNLSGQYLPFIEQATNFLNPGIQGFQWVANNLNIVTASRANTNNTPGNTIISYHDGNFLTDPYNTKQTGGNGSLTIKTDVTLATGGLVSDLFRTGSGPFNFFLFFEDKNAELWTSASSGGTGAVLDSSGFLPVTAAKVINSGNQILYSPAATPDKLFIDTLNTANNPLSNAGAGVQVIDLAFSGEDITGIDVFNGGIGLVVTTATKGYFYTLTTAYDYTTATMTREISSDLAAPGNISSVTVAEIAGIVNLYVTKYTTGTNDTELLTISTSYDGIEPVIADVSYPIGYALEAGLAGNTINVLLKNSGEFDYAGASPGDELCINLLGEIELNAATGSFAYCIEADKMRIYDGTEGLILYPTRSLETVIDPAPLPGGLQTIANLQGAGIVKEIQLQGIGDNSTINGLSITRHRNTEVLDLNYSLATLDGNSGLTGNIIKVPLNIEYRDGISINLDCASNAVNADIRAVVIYKEIV